MELNKKEALEMPLFYLIEFDNFTLFTLSYIHCQS